MQPYGAGTDATVMYPGVVAGGCGNGVSVGGQVVTADSTTSGVAYHDAYAPEEEEAAQEVEEWENEVFDP